MNALFEAALETQNYFQQNEWRFCIIGGLAVARWGQPRATQDVDISLLTGFGNEREYVDSIFSEFAQRIGDARDFALESRVVLARASNGVALDIALAAFPYEERVISRATAYRYSPDVSLLTASAEDLVVLKSFAGREQDWVDVDGIVVRCPELDWNYVDENLSELCELQEDYSAAERLRSIRELHDV